MKSAGLNQPGLARAASKANAPVSQQVVHHASFGPRHVEQTPARDRRSLGRQPGLAGARRRTDRHLAPLAVEEWGGVPGIRARPHAGAGHRRMRPRRLDDRESADRHRHHPAPVQSVRRAKAYAVYIVGDSMEPRYYAGELAHIHPGKPITIGAFVLVQIRPEHDGDTPKAVLKRLVKRSATKIVLEQYNPPKKFEIKADDIVSLHRVVGSGES